MTAFECFVVSALFVNAYVQPQGSHLLLTLAGTFFGAGCSALLAKVLP